MSKVGQSIDLVQAEHRLFTGSSNGVAGCLVVVVNQRFQMMLFVAGIKICQLVVQQSGILFEVIMTMSQRYAEAYGTRLYLLLRVFFSLSAQNCLQQNSFSNI